MLYLLSYYVLLIAAKITMIEERVIKNSFFYLGRSSGFRIYALLVREYRISTNVKWNLCQNQNTA